jgi:hypothetical protein
MKLEQSSSKPCVSQDVSSPSESPSTGSSSSGGIGRRLTDVLATAWHSPFTVKSDFARAQAVFIAMAASDGLITTREAAGLYGNVWRITQRGLERLRILRGED